MRYLSYIATLLAGLLLGLTASVFAWSGPSGSPPSGNVSAPLNVGATSQVKNGTIGVNGLGVYGNSLIDASLNPTPSTTSYLNFSNTATPVSGSSGYGIRDNNGTLEFKNTGGSWQSMQTEMYNYFASTSPSQWTTNGTSIYYSGGSVGIGTANPAYPLEVSGDLRADGWLRTSGATGWYSDTYGGGWYMQDSTWIRSYGGKSVYMANGFDTGSPSGVGCGGGLGEGYNFAVCGNEYVTGNVYVASRGMWMSETARQDGGQFGIWGAGNSWGAQCPGGSVTVGGSFGATVYMICQWIN